MVEAALRWRRVRMRRRISIVPIRRISPSLPEKRWGGITSGEGTGFMAERKDRRPEGAHAFNDPYGIGIGSVAEGLLAAEEGRLLKAQTREDPFHALGGEGADVRS